MRSDAQIDPVDLAQTQWALAMALVAVSRANGRDLPRALELAGRARVILARAGIPERATLEALDAWLETHSTR
jgi:hypothetical protein